MAPVPHHLAMAGTRIQAFVGRVVVAALVAAGLVVTAPGAPAAHAAGSGTNGGILYQLYTSPGDSDRELV